MHAMTDFQASHDKQLTKIWSVLQEFVGDETKPIQLMTKILPIMEHYVSKPFGVIKDFYSRRRLTLTGKGQDIVVSVRTCRDSSCMMLKDIEK